MKIALLTLSASGLGIAGRIREGLPDADLYVHSAVTAKVPPDTLRRFAKIVGLTHAIFDQYDGHVFIMPCGVAVRAISGCIRGKHVDPAVVVIDVGARFAVSLLSGHEGGANDLAIRVANLTGAEPAISTTTEAEKNIIIGVGCRKGTGAEKIREAIAVSLAEAGVAIEDVRLIATADIKAREAGLVAAAAGLGVPLRIIPSDLIRAYAGAFTPSAFVTAHVNLPAVAEPAALLAGRRTQLIREKKNYNGVTVAVARESSIS